MDIFGVPVQALMAQLMIGLVNGCFYAVLSLGLAVIFGMLHVINFTHGAMFMLGALLSWAGLYYFELNYWVMLLLAPLVVGVFGIVLERLFLKRIYKLDYLYGLLLTLGLTLIIEGAVRSIYGVSGKPYGPAPISGVTDLGFLMIPNYRLWVIVASLLVCAATWYTIERTRLGAYLRAATENPKLVEAFGINVPVLVSLTFGFGVALAAFAGVLAAPIMQVSALTGQTMIVIVFAVVVIGGMGSIAGTVVTGIGLGLVEALTKVYYPEASSMVMFLVMVLVLLVRPNGLFGGGE